MADPGTLFDYDVPSSDSAATSQAMRNQFSALAQNFYTTDPNVPDTPKRGQFRILDDPAAVPQNIKLQWYDGVAWVTLLQNLQNIPELSGGAGISLLASGGLKLVLDQLAVEPADIAGTGLEDDGADNLRVKPDTTSGGSIIPVNVVGDGVGVDTTLLPPGGGPGSDTTAIHDDTAGEISALTEKVSPAAGDHIIIEDSAAGDIKKRVQIGNLGGGGPGSDTTAVHTDTAGEIDAVTPKATPVGADKLLLEDSAATWDKKSVTLTSLVPLFGGGGAGSGNVPGFQMAGNFPTLSECQVYSPNKGDSSVGYSADGTVGYLISRLRDVGSNLSDFSIHPLTPETVSIAGTPPNGVSGLIIWLDASDDDNTVEVAGNFQQLTDKSGTGNNFAQLTASLQPLVSALGGLQAAKFDGVDDRLRNTVAGLSNASGTILMVFQLASGVTSVLMGNERFDFHIHSTSLTNLSMSDFSSSWRTDAAVHTVGTTLVAGITGDGAAYDFYSSGVLEADTKITGSGFGDGDWHDQASGGTDDDLNLGNNVAVAAPLDGWIGEYCEYNRVLTPTEILNVSTYLTNKWITNNIPVTSGLMLWLDFSDDTFLTLVSGKVSEALDKSGNEWDFLQGSDSSRPIRDTAINGVAAARFFGNDKYLENNTVEQANSVGTLFIVAEYNITSTADQWIYAMSSASNMLIGFEYRTTSAGTPVITNTGRHEVTSTITGSGQPFILCIVQTGSDYEFYVNNILFAKTITAGSGGGGIWHDDKLIPTRIGHPNGGFDGKIGAVVEYSSALGVGDRTTVHDFLATRWMTVPATWPNGSRDLLNWYDFSDETTHTIVDGKFSDISDKTLSGYDMTQPTPGNRLFLSTIGLLSAARSELDGRWLETTAVLTPLRKSSVGSVIVVVSFRTIPATFSYQYVFAGVQGFGTTTSNDIFLPNRVTTGAVLNTTTPLYVIAFTNDGGTTGKIYLDGSLQAVTGANNAWYSTGTLTKNTIGSDALGSGPSDCRIGEILEYGRELTAGEISDITTVLTNKWAVTNTPDELTGLRVWVDFSYTPSITFGSGTSIAGIRDRRSAISFLQADSALQPDRSETINGVLAATFDSAGDWLRVSGLSLAHAAGTVIMVIEIPVQPYPISTQVGLFAFADTTKFGSWRLGATGGVNKLDYYTTINGTGILETQDIGMPNGQVSIVTLTSDGAVDIKLYVDGTLVPSTITGTGTLSWMDDTPSGHAKDLYIGQHGNWAIGGTNAPYQGKIGEILVYDRVLSAGEITTVHTNYLNPKWLNWTLPVTASLIMHIDFSDTATTTKSGGKFTDITDKSGNSFDYTQATDASRPLVGSLNGLDAAQFAAGSEYMENLTKVPSGTDATIFVVFKNTETFTVIKQRSFYNVRTTTGDTSGVGIRFQTSSSLRWCAFHDWEVVTDDAAIWEDSSPLVPLVNPTVMHWTVGGAPGGKTWGGSIGETAVTHLLLWSPGEASTGWYNSLSGTINQHRIGTSGSAAMLGPVGLLGEIMIFSTVLNAGDRARVRGYLTKKWGV